MRTGLVFKNLMVFRDNLLAVHHLLVALRDSVPPPTFNGPHLRGGTWKALSKRLILDLAEVIDHSCFQTSTLKVRGALGKQACHQEAGGWGTTIPPPKAGYLMSPCLPTSWGIWGPGAPPLGLQVRLPGP